VAFIDVAPVPRAARIALAGPCIDEADLPAPPPMPRAVAAATVVRRLEATHNALLRELTSLASEHPPAVAEWGGSDPADIHGGVSLLGSLLGHCGEPGTVGDAAQPLSFAELCERSAPLRIALAPSGDDVTMVPVSASSNSSARRPLPLDDVSLHTPDASSRDLLRLSPAHMARSLSSPDHPGYPPVLDRWVGPRPADDQSLSGSERRPSRHTHAQSSPVIRPRSGSPGGPRRTITPRNGPVAPQPHRVTAWTDPEASSSERPLVSVVFSTDLPDPQNPAIVIRHAEIAVLPLRLRLGLGLVDRITALIASALAASSSVSHPPMPFAAAAPDPSALEASQMLSRLRMTLGEDRQRRVLRRTVSVLHNTPAAYAPDQGTQPLAPPARLGSAISARDSTEPMDAPGVTPLAASPASPLSATPIHERGSATLSSAMTAVSSLSATADDNGDDVTETALLRAAAAAAYTPPAAAGGRSSGSTRACLRSDARLWGADAAASSRSRALATAHQLGLLPRALSSGSGGPGARAQAVRSLFARRPAPARGQEERDDGEPWLGAGAEEEPQVGLGHDALAAAALASQYMPLGDRWSAMLVAPALLRLAPATDTADGRAVFVCDPLPWLPGAPMLEGPGRTAVGEQSARLPAATRRVGAHMAAPRPTSAAVAAAAALNGPTLFFIRSLCVNEVLVMASVAPEGVVTMPRLSRAVVKIHRREYRGVGPITATGFAAKMRRDVVRDVLSQASRNMGNIGSMLADFFTRRAVRLAREEEEAMDLADEQA